MCGISGVLGYPVEEKRVKDCLNMMRHRGPNHQASQSWTLPNGKSLTFLHARLSIIDTNPRAHQPYTIKSQTIITNGELYNYKELRQELEKDGVPFQTESDTEVMLSSIIHWGLKALDKFEGMWAFALYDSNDHSLILCRDRFGEKPLYYYKDSKSIYFGSEIKFIFQLRGKPLNINHDHLLRYMVNGYKALYKNQKTFYQGLCEVPPGQWIKVNLKGQMIEERYWKPHLNQELDMTREEAIRGVRERLINSVELRLRADVPLAFCMSGGVDSNSLIGIAKRIHKFDVHGFTIVNTDSRYEENDMVDIMVKELSIKHSKINLTTSHFLSNLKELIRQHDAPIYTITYYTHWMLLKNISEQGYRISISGTGADELFTGYFDHHLAFIYDIRNELKLMSEAKNNWSKHIKPIVRNPYLKNATIFVDNPNFRDHIFLNADKNSNFLVDSWKETFNEIKFTDELLRNRMLNELFHENVPPILHEDDINAMTFSVENRSPFLDRELFEFSNRIPTRYLIHNGYAKSILREAMRGIVPDPILDNHRKVGFNAPIFSLLDTTDPQIRKSLLSDSPIFDMVNREEFKKLLEKPDLLNSESKFLFSAINAKYFLEGCA